MEQKDGMRTIFEFRDVNGCDFFSQKSTSINFLLIYQKMFTKAGKLLTCPLHKDLELNYKCLSIDPNRFPYLPDTKFLLTTVFSDAKGTYLAVNISGQVIDNMKRKHKLGWIGLHIALVFTYYILLEITYTKFILNNLLLLFAVLFMFFREEVFFVVKFKKQLNSNKNFDNKMIPKI